MAAWKNYWRTHELVCQWVNEARWQLRQLIVIVVVVVNFIVRIIIMIIVVVIVVVTSTFACASSCSSASADTTSAHNSTSNSDVPCGVTNVKSILVCIVIVATAAPLAPSWRQSRSVNVALAWGDDGARGKNRSGW